MKKNLLSLMSLFLFLAMTCVSCSHTKQMSADAGLAEETNQETASADVSEQGSTSEETAQVSEEAQSKASDLLNGGEEAKIDLGATVAENKTTETDAALALSDAPKDPMQVAEAMGQEAKIVETVALAPTVEPVQEQVVASEPVPEPVMEQPKEVEAPKAVAPKRSIAKHSTPRSTAPKVAKAAVVKEEKVATATAMEADEFHAPIPQAEEKKAPKLASADLASFVERHVFMVSLVIAGCLFGLFIMMRRQHDKDDNRFPM